MNPGDPVRLSEPGTTNNPELAGMTGTVLDTGLGWVEVRWAGDDPRSCWIRGEYVEVADGR